MVDAPITKYVGKKPKTAPIPQPQKPTKAPQKQYAKRGK